MSYRVILEGSNDGVRFCFRNYDDAFQFASMAVDNGTYTDWHYERNGDDAFGVRVEDEPRPIIVSIQGVDD